MRHTMPGCESTGGFGTCGTLAAVTPDDYLTRLKQDGTRLARVADGHLDAPVPSCPDWTVLDLVGHVGSIHAWVEGIVRTGAQERVRRARMPADVEPVGWYEDGLDRLIATLSEADLEAAVWNWSERDFRVGWWVRRMAQETAVHRVDGELAAGTVTPIDPDLAVDGVDEWVDVIVGPDEAAAIKGDGEIIHLHRTDGDDGWMLRLTPAGLETSRGHPDDPTSVIRAPASDLLMVLWRRMTREQTIAEGDTELLDRFLASVEL